MTGCRVGQGRSDSTVLFPLTPRQTVREVFPHTAFLNIYTPKLSPHISLFMLALSLRKTRQHTFVWF